MHEETQYICEDVNSSTDCFKCEHGKLHSSKRIGRFDACSSKATFCAAVHDKVCCMEVKLSDDY